MIYLGLEMIVGPIEQCNLESREISGVFVQYPDTCGSVVDYSEIAKRANKNGVSSIISAINSQSLCYK